MKKKQEGTPLTEDLVFSPTDIEFLEVDEASKAKGERRVRLTVIKAGLSKNMNYYSPAILQKLPPFVEAHPKMYLDHDMWGFWRSMKEWAATINSVWYDEKDTSVKAEARMTANPATSWLYEEMKVDPSDVGCSIDARVNAHEEEMEIDDKGTKATAKVIDGWVVLNSVDFVTYAAAGGGIDRVAASENPVDLLTLIVKAVIEAQSSKTKNQEEASMDLAELKKLHPDLVQAIMKEALDASQLHTLEEKNRALEAEKVTLTEANASAKREADEAKTKAQAVETEKQALQAKLDVYVTKEAEAAHKASIDEKLAKCVEKGTLKQDQISDKFKELLYGIQDSAKIDVLIAEREEAFSKAGVTGNGPRGNAAPQNNKPKMTADDFVAGVKARR